MIRPSLPRSTGRDNSKMQRASYNNLACARPGFGLFDQVHTVDRPFARNLPNFHFVSLPLIALLFLGSGNREPGPAQRTIIHMTAAGALRYGQDRLNRGRALCAARQVSRWATEAVRSHFVILGIAAGSGTWPRLR